MSEAAKTTPTFAVNIWLAGAVGDAKRLCREFCMGQGLCVTVTETTFIYTGGAEEGVLVRLLNYPRFPVDPEAIEDTAMRLARHLRDGLFQWSVLVETPDRTIWLTTREEAQASKDVS